MFKQCLNGFRMWIRCSYVNAVIYVDPGVSHLLRWILVEIWLFEQVTKMEDANCQSSSFVGSVVQNHQRQACQEESKYFYCKLPTVSLRPPFLHVSLHQHEIWSPRSTRIDLLYIFCYIWLLLLFCQWNSHYPYSPFFRYLNLGTMGSNWYRGCQQAVHLSRFSVLWCSVARFHQGVLCFRSGWRCDHFWCLRFSEPDRSGQCCSGCYLCSSQNKRLPSSFSTSYRQLQIWWHLAFHRCYLLRLCLCWDGPCTATQVADADALWEDCFLAIFKETNFRHGCEAKR